MRRFPLRCAGLFVVLGLGGVGAVAQEQAAKPMAGDAVAGRLIKRVPAVYPPEAKRRFVQGLVVIHARISRDGSVTDATVVSGNPMLTKAALEAVVQWKYEPYRLDGVATEVETTINLNFDLGTTAGQGPPVATPMPAAPAAAALPPPPAGVMRVSGGAMAGLLDKRVEPVYPADSVGLDARGVEVLLVTVTSAGEVSDVQVISGPPRFRDAATAAVRQWRYHPYTVEGQAVEVQTKVSLDFVPSR